MLRTSAAPLLATIQLTVSLSIGAYATGKISRMAGSLGMGLAALLALDPVSLVLLWLAAGLFDRRPPLVP